MCFSQYVLRIPVTDDVRNKNVLNNKIYKKITNNQIAKAEIQWAHEERHLG